MSNVSELVRFAAKKILEQGAASAKVGPFGPVCLYRDPKGRKCAVGILIKDEYYDPALEGLSLGYSCPVASAVEKSLGRDLSKVEITDLQVLQNCHDSAAYHEDSEEFKVVFKQKYAEAFREELEDVG